MIPMQKRAAYTLFISVLFLAACQNKGQMTPEERKATEMEVGAYVTEMYTEIADWYNTHRDSNERNDFDERFTSWSYRQLRDEAGRLGEQMNDIPPCGDYDHWIQAQDWERVIVQTDSVHVLAHDTAKVYVTIQNLGSRSPLCLLMLKHARGCHDAEGQWFIDDFLTDDFEGHPYGTSERKQMQEWVHYVWLQGVWDYVPDSGEVASHYIIPNDTLIYPKRCDPVEWDTYTFTLSADTLYLHDTQGHIEWKLQFSFRNGNDGKLWTKEFFPPFAGEDVEIQTFESVKRNKTNK